MVIPPSAPFGVGAGPGGGMVIGLGADRITGPPLWRGRSRPTALSPYSTTAPSGGRARRPRLAQRPRQCYGSVSSRPRRGHVLRRAHRGRAHRTMQKVGEFEISRVVESEVPFIEPNVFLPDFTPDAFEANRDWLLPRYADVATGKLIFAFQSYIVRTPRHTILVDTCVGNDKPRPHRPAWHMQNWSYLADLALAGVKP